MIKEFADVYEMVEELKKEEGEFDYRGQCENWPLCPSMYRSSNINEEDIRTRNFCGWLKDNHYLELEDAVARWGENVYYAIAQHYGYGTDLIDFTTDIEVAAFFASDYEKYGQKDAAEKGVLWRISKFEKENLPIIVKDFVVPQIKEKEILKLFEKNGFSPFFEIQIKGLSRLNNQKGVFLWDYGRILTQMYFAGPDFSFSHRGKAYQTEKISKAYIYPYPNVLEREIERYKYSESIINWQNGELYHFLHSSSNVGNIAFSDVNEENEELIEKLETNKWLDACWDKVTNDFYPNEDSYVEKPYEIWISEQIEVAKWEKIVAMFHMEVKKGTLIYFKFSDVFLEEVVNDMIRTLILYSYTNRQIAEMLFYAQKYIGCIESEIKKNGKSTVNSVEDFIRRRIRDLDFLSERYVAGNIYGEDVVELEFGDEQGSASRCSIPISWLHRLDKAYKVKQYVETKKYLKVQQNINVRKDDFMFYLVQLTTIPQKLFDLEDIMEVFIKCLIPSEFIFRGTNGRIYIPRFLTVVGLV